jgi:hypothetical protein
MGVADAQPDPGDPRRLSVELRRTSERLRSLSVARLAAPTTDGRSHADAAREVAQALADRSAALDGRQPRRLPDLPDLAVGDMLSVCGHDLVEQLQVWPDPPACRAAVAELVALRRLL